MLEIFMVMGWPLLGILLLCLWSDVRAVKRELKNYRRDFMRNSVGGRTSDHYRGFSEEAYWSEARQEAEGAAGEVSGEIKCIENDSHGEKCADAPPEGERSRTLTLKPGEEQVLREILLEFLG